MLEKTIQEIIVRYPHEVWPELSLVYVESYRQLPKGKILDLHFKTPNGIHWIIELKRHRVTSSTIFQLLGYLDELCKLEPEIPFRGMAVAPIITSNGQATADSHNIVCTALDEVHLERIAISHGLPISHASGHRPKLSGAAKIRSRPKGPPKARPATTKEDVAFLQALDRRFPPGTLNCLTSSDQLLKYWSFCTPNAPFENQEIAAKLSYEVLKILPHGAISNRSPGKSDSYTTIRGLDGRVAAALDARSKFVKFDFPLPLELANRCKNDGLLTIWNKRGYSVWVQSRVGTKLPFKKAVELLRIGIPFEFSGQA